MSSTEKDITLHIPDSDVSVNIPKCPNRIPYLGHVSTDFSKYLNKIPEEECFVSPLVEVDEIVAQVAQDASASQQISLGIGPEIPVDQLPSGEAVEMLFTTSIPHIVKKSENWKHISVRKFTQEPQTFEQILAKDKTDTNSEGFWVDENYINIHTRSFSIFCCTIHKEHCDGALKVFLFGNLVHWKKKTTRVDMKLFMCSSLFDLKAFREVRTCQCKANVTLATSIAN